MFFCGSGLIRGVVFVESGLIRGGTVVHHHLHVCYFLYFSAKRVHYFYMVVKFVILVTFIALLYMSEVSQTLYTHNSSISPT